MIRHTVRSRGVLLLMLMICLASACAQPTPTEAPTSTPTRVPPTDTPTTVPTDTPIPPTDTPVPTPTKTPKPTPTPMANPEPMGYLHMVYDSESNVIVMVPRQGNNIKLIIRKTWHYDLESNTWTRFKDGPGNGEGPAAYDSQSDRMIMFLGTQLSVDKDLKPFRQTLAYDANTNTWEELETNDGPYGTLGARMVYDSESDKVILMGGWEVSDFTDQPDTWSFDYETLTWTNMEPTTAPPPGLNYFSMSYDPVADRVIVWRKQQASSDEYQGYSLGVYDYNTNTWETRFIDPHPIAHDYGWMVYDPNSGLHLFFGGIDIPENVYDELWGYDYTADTWTLIPTKNTPSARGWFSMVYHEQENVIVLFGGGDTRNTFTNETWVLDPLTWEWTEMTQ